MKNVTLSSKTLPQCEPVNRVEYILSLCRGKNVLHIGCVDYPLLLDRIAEGTLLHDRLDKVASTLWGVDRDEAGVDALKRMMDTENFLVCDAERLEPDQFQCSFDIVLVAEVLEHLSCPSALLRNISPLLGPRGHLVISVPNAHSFRNFAHSILGREKVHSDHKTWFSFCTIRALLADCGFSTLDIHPYSQPPRPRGIGRMWDQTVRLICKKRPWMSEGLVITASVLSINEENVTEKI